VSEPNELRQLFHALNNQLGIILSHAELLEAKASDEHQRARASQVVATSLEALDTTRRIRAALQGEAQLAERGAATSRTAAAAVSGALEPAAAGGAERDESLAWLFG